MGWAEALLPYRASDDPQGFLGAALLAQDQNLFRLAATWPFVKVTPPSPPLPSEGLDWNHVWSNTRVDFESWAQMTQLPAVAVLAGFEALQRNRLIMSDGSLNHLVETLLQKEAAGQFMTKLGLKPGDLK